MRIALAQIDCRLGNIPANIETHRHALQEVRERGGADLTLFPELSLTGYRLRSDIHRAALNDDHFTNAWRRMRDGLLPATSYCSFGCVELNRRAVLHNTTTLMRGEDDAPVLRHRKVYLPTYGMFEEERYMRPGRHFGAVDIPLSDGETWRVGILCCEDAWHSSAWTILQARGVDLILVSSASPGRGVESERLGSQRSWYGILATHAEMSGCWVAFSNRVGFEDDIHFWGGSAVFSPSGEITAQAALMEPDLLVCDIPKRAISQARIMTPLIADENWDLTLRELEDAYAETLEEASQ